MSTFASDPAALCPPCIRISPGDESMRRHRDLPHRPPPITPQPCAGHSWTWHAREVPKPQVTLLTITMHGRVEPFERTLVPVSQDAPALRPPHELVGALVESREESCHHRSPLQTDKMFSILSVSG